MNTANIEGFTVLMHSVCEGNFEAADTLIKEGADVNAQDERGRTALMFAVSRNNPEIIEALIQAGADVNDEDDLGFTALMWAASESTPEIVKALINAGANLDARDSELCLTALEMASNPEIISILTDASKKTAPRNYQRTAKSSRSTQNH